jgi:hypothetical protein
MDLAQAVFELETYGFTVLPAVLAADEVADLRARNAALEASVGEDHRFAGRARHLSNLVAADPAYLRLIDHPAVLPVVEALVGPDLILGSLNSRILRPGDPAQELHGDVEAPVRREGRPLMVNTVWMLDDFTAENGATRVVPGSHRMPQPWPPAERAVPHVVQATGTAGSVIVFDGRTWHGGGANRTERDRHGVFGHYRAGRWMLFQCDPHRGFDPAWLPRMTPRQRQLLRMEQGVRGEAWLQDGYG